MSASNPKYQPYISLRLTSSVYHGINDILPFLKRKDKRWNISRIVNVALFAFLRSFPSMSDAELEKMFEEYDRVWDKQKEEENGPSNER
jgi:hypothetical protein